MGVLSASETRIVAALAEAMFPRERGVDVNGVEAGIAAYVDDYVAALPTFERGQIRALLAAFDRGFGVFRARPSQRFAGASLPERRDYVESWARSNTYTGRMVFEGLRTVMTIAFAESPAVRAAIGAGDGYEVALARQQEREQLRLAAGEEETR